MAPMPGARQYARQVGRQTALLPGTSDRVGYWITPPELAAWRDARWGPPTFDPCPYPRPAGYDGLIEPWEGGLAWVNPPFEGRDSRATAWARKAIQERDRGVSSLMILPTLTAHWELARAGAVAHAAPPRIAWMNPQGDRRKGRPAIVWEMRAAGGA